jgi:hypothetical protein
LHPLALGTSRDEFAVSSNDIGRNQGITAEAMLATEPPQPTAEGQSCDAGLGDDTKRRREAEGLGLAVEISQRCAASGPRPADNRIDTHGVHARKIDHHAVVARGIAGDIVTAAANSYQEVIFSGKSDRTDHIGCTAASDNNGWAFIRQCVPNSARLVVARASCRKEGATQTR